MKSYRFVYGIYIKKMCEWGPVFIEKNFPGVTPPSPSQLKQVFIWETVDPFTRAENSARACSDFLSLTELMTRLGKSSVYLEKSWLRWRGDLTIEKGL